MERNGVELAAVHIPVVLRDRIKKVAPLVGKTISELVAESVEPMVAEIEKKYLKRVPTA